MTNDEMMTGTQIRYLLTLRKLYYTGELKNGIKTTDVAKALCVSKPSVHKMMNCFLAMGYIAKGLYHQVYLTEKGVQKAGLLEIYYRAVAEKLAVPGEQEACYNRAICAFLADASRDYLERLILGGEERLLLNENKSTFSTWMQAMLPGIEIIYVSAHEQELDLQYYSDVPSDTFEIFHCREGRMELQLGNDYCYISPGDLLLVRAQEISSSFYFPLKHYHGLIVRVNLAKAPRCFSCIIQDVNVQPHLVAGRFCRDKGYYIARSNASFEHIFSEMYNIPDVIRRGYLKIKVLELMLFLSVYDVQVEKTRPLALSPAQVYLAKAVGKYLGEHMEERFTLEQASQMFNASTTSIKNAFKAVYGVPFYAFIKAGKMESAACMLEHTDKTIAQIAGEHGYDNSGKFASAFRAVKGMSPGDYRQQVLKYDNGGDVWKIW